MTITVDIHTPFNEVLPGSVIPEDYRIQQVIDELIDELRLPRVDGESARVEYALYSLNTNAYLLPEDSVTKVLRNGDAIRLEAKGDGDKVNINPEGTSAPLPTIDDESNEITVDLKVMDLNRVERVTLSTLRSISDLIEEILANYQLPAENDQGQNFMYRLRSKALGHYLPADSTLSEAKVPKFDTLSLHRKEEAGSA